MTPQPVADETLDLLCEALDSDDDVRRFLMVALALMGSPTITAEDMERLRRDGPPPVFRM